MTELHERIQALLLAEPSPDLYYYSLTLLLADNGAPGYSCFSGWTGFTDETPRREIRKASLVHADRMLSSWRELEEPGMVIHTLDDFALFFAFGGNAVVEKHVAEAVIPEWLAPTPVASVGEWGFAALGALPDSALRRATAPKHRMRILRRDNYRCRVCGRSSNDHVDVELHVHHIRPWASGGMTEDKNLITLCHTCHAGLDPHFERSLYKLLPRDPSTDRGLRYRKQLHEYQAELAAHAERGDV